MLRRLLLSTVLICGCTELKPGSDRADVGSSDAGLDTSNDDASFDASVDAFVPTDAPVDVPVDVGDSLCPPLFERTEVIVDGEVTTSQTWSCENTYRLLGQIYVRSPAVLTIDFGVRVLGTRIPDPEPEKSALIVERGARLVVRGTANDPVVFTSAEAEGTRVRGDWAGVALLGAAPINAGEERPFEGLPDEPRNRYGGNDETHNCGDLRYMRIEFAGNRISADKELNGLSLAGCGNQTMVEFVQVHLGFDDGVEVFGGAPNLRHLVVTGARDDSLDWDQGFQGRMQFVILQQHGDVSDNGIEADNLDGSPDATPRSSPTIYNMTMIGGANGSAGILLRRGTHARIHNTIISGFPSSAVNIASAETAAGAGTAMTVANSFFFENLSGNHFDAFETDDDGGFSELAFFSDPAQANSFNVDPEIGEPNNLTAPVFVPDMRSPAATGGATPPDDGFFDRSATYAGAIEPGGVDWTLPWTSYPAN